MTAATVQVRNGLVEEYLQLLRSLASEMEKAMQAIAHNALSDLEESVSSQQIITARLQFLANEISPPLKSNPAACAADAEPVGMDEAMMSQVRAAADSLQKLNRRYAALLEHSSRSIALMASLFSSYQGQFKEASGPRLKHQTWSCRM